MKTLRILALFLHDIAWTAFTVLLCSVLPIACLLLLGTDELGIDWPYYLFLSLFIFIVLCVVRLARSWDFYEEAERAARESRTPDLKKVRGLIPEARWAKQAASQTEERCAEEAHALAVAQSERDAIVLSWVHHAKTPIAVIKLISESESQDTNMERIGSAARELDRSLDSLLQSVRVGSPEEDLRITKVDAAILARKAINNIRDLFIEREVYPTLQAGEGLIAYGDEKLISIVLDQVLSNAVKYSPPSSQVSVSVKRSIDGKRVEILIEDEGCGISPEDAGRVFRPFFTGANGRRGEASTGIGLFLAKKAADATDAELSLSRRAEGGTAALITLPAANTSAR